jgi:endonuclease/exonuclease/phosphatase family metal-dependent hydrolase
MDSGYKIVDVEVGLSHPNNSCIAYNPEKVRLSRHGYEIYSKGDRAHLRLASWAKFEDLDSGKAFIVVNTHWDIVAEYQMIQAVEMAELVLDLQKKYGCPVITTGDYNRREDTAEYKKYVEITDLKDSKYTALTKGNAHTTTGHGFSQPAKMVNPNVIESIDHIFGDDRVEFRYFTVLTDQLTRDSSDHCPIFADIKLN